MYKKLKTLPLFYLFGIALFCFAGIGRCAEAQTYQYTYIDQVNAIPLSSQVGTQPQIPAHIFEPSPTSHLIARFAGSSAPSGEMSYLSVQQGSAYNTAAHHNDLTPHDATDYNFASAQAVRSLPQSLPVSVRYANWVDATRNRRIPVKMYMPGVVTEKCPVIVFSHGLGGSYEKCDYLGQKWAANGFVSVHIQHIGIDEDVWKRKIRPMKELKEVYNHHWSGRMQAVDIRFVLDQLDHLVASEPSFAQQFDMSQVGVAGYDLGGLASMLVAGQLPPDQGTGLRDPRVKAIVVMSPPVFSHVSHAPLAYQPMQAPALFFSGTDDNGVVGSTKSWQRRIPFDYMQGNDRFLVTYQGAGHMIYGGHIRSLKNQEDQKYQTNIAQVSTLFWRAYLKEEPAVQAYFYGPTLGHAIGMLGQIERRLSPTDHIMPAVAQSHTVENVSDFAPDFRQQYVTDHVQE